MKSSHYYYCKVEDAWNVMTDAKNVSRDSEDSWYSRFEAFEYGLTLLKAAAMEFEIDAKLGKIKCSDDGKNRCKDCEYCCGTTEKIIVEFGGLKFGVAGCTNCYASSDVEKAEACAWVLKDEVEHILECYRRAGNSFGFLGYGNVQCFYRYLERYVNYFLNSIDSIK